MRTRRVGSSTSSDAPDWWRLARAFHAAGFRKGDVVHNCFGYHLTPAGAMMESAAHAIGCCVFPGGIGNTEQQVAAMAAVLIAARLGIHDWALWFAWQRAAVLLAVCAAGGGVYLLGLWMMGMRIGDFRGAR